MNRTETRAEIQRLADAAAAIESISPVDFDDGLTCNGCEYTELMRKINTLRARPEAWAECGDCRDCVLMEDANFEMGWRCISHANVCESGVDSVWVTPAARVCSHFRK